MPTLGSRSRVVCNGRRQMKALSLCGAAGWCLGACASTGPSDAGYVQVESAWVVGLAKADVAADGRFTLASPLPQVAGELSRDESLQLANAVVVFVGSAVGGVRAAIESDHGGPINWAHLAPCGRRITPAFSNLEDPSASVPAYVRTPAGPSYYVEYCDGPGLRAVEVQVFVRTLARVLPDGSIQFPVPSGTEFVVLGIPLHQPIDLSPELAVRLVFQRLGERIAYVPEQDGCTTVVPVCFGVNGRHWKVRVEHPIQVRLASGATIVTDEFFTQAGFGNLSPGTVYVAAEIQPAPAWLRYTVFQPGQSDRIDSVLQRIVRPVRMEEFQVLK
jgi:hypothetical protein